MSTLRQELETVLQFKQNSGVGFLYIHQARQLADKAHQARQWHNLIKTPIPRWKQTLAETRFVLDELDKTGITTTVKQ